MNLEDFDISSIPEEELENYEWKVYYKDIFDDYHIDYVYRLNSDHVSACEYPEDQICFNIRWNKVIEFYHVDDYPEHFI